MTISSISITIHQATREIVSVSRQIFPLSSFSSVWIGLYFDCNKKLRICFSLNVEKYPKMCNLYWINSANSIATLFFLLKCHEDTKKDAELFCFLLINFHKERIKFRSLGHEKCSCRQNIALGLKLSKLSMIVLSELKMT